MRTWLARSGKLALTVLVTWFIVDRVGLGLDEVRALEPGAWVPNVPVLAASAVLLLGGYFASAALWGLIVADLGGPRLPVPEAVRLFMIANLGRYVPGKLWQIASLATLARGRGVKGSRAAAAAVLGQGVALAAATLVGLGGFLAAPAGLRAWGVGAATVIAAVVMLVAVPPVFRGIAGLWLRLTGTPAPEGVQGTHGVRWLTLYVLNWTLYAFSFWVLVASFGLQAPVLPVASAFAAAYVLGYLMVFAPAGIGVREGFLVALLTPHLGVVASGAVAVIARLWTTVVELAPAAAFWLRHLGTVPPDAEEAGDE